VGGQISEVAFFNPLSAATFFPRSPSPSSIHSNETLQAVDVFPFYAADFLTKKYETVPE